VDAGTPARSVVGYFVICDKAVTPLSQMNFRRPYQSAVLIFDEVFGYIYINSLKADNGAAISVFACWIVSIRRRKT